MISREEFLAKYLFSKEKEGYFGVEIEYFLSMSVDVLVPVPESPKFLAGMNSVWGYELSACQVEYHTAPAQCVGELVEDLRRGWVEGKRRSLEIGAELVAYELAPENMSLEIYKDDARYAALAKRLSEHILRAACRVAGTHIHVGVDSLEQALFVYNTLAKSTDEFLRSGDHSNGERIRLYKVMAPNFQSPEYRSGDDLYETATAQGFAYDPRSCYHFVRLNPKGTVEIRAYGTTSDFEEIGEWVKRVKGLVS